MSDGPAWKPPEQGEGSWGSGPPPGQGAGPWEHRRPGQRRRTLAAAGTRARDGRHRIRLTTAAPGYGGYGGPGQGGYGGPG